MTPVTITVTIQTGRMLAGPGGIVLTVNGSATSGRPGPQPGPSGDSAQGRYCNTTILRVWSKPPPRRR